MKDASLAHGVLEPLGHHLSGDIMQNQTLRRLRAITLAALFAVLATPLACSKIDTPTGPSPLGATLTPPATAPSTGPTDTEVQTLVDLVNNHRRSRGLPALIWDDRVAAVALAHSQDMVDRNFYGHINPDGEGPNDRLREAGIEYSWWAENYCYGFSTASQAFNFWMNSPPHRANLESTAITHQGVGKVGNVWTQDFIKPKNLTTGVEMSSTSSLDR